MNKEGALVREPGSFIKSPLFNIAIFRRVNAMHRRLKMRRNLKSKWQWWNDKGSWTWEIAQYSFFEQAQYSW